MKKVLYIMGSEPVGGIGSVVKNYQSYFCSDKIRVDFIVFEPEEDTPFNREVKKNGSVVYLFPRLCTKNLLKIFILLQRFYRTHEGEYKIVHIHSPNIAWLCFFHAKHYGIKYRIVHSHATSYADKKIKALRNKILCMPIKYGANIYMACSWAAGEFLFGEKNSSKIIIVKNAIDCNKYKFSPEIRRQMRETLGIHDNIVIGHVGRFCEQKNHEFLIEIFARIIELESRAMLLLVGDGPLKERIMKIVKEKGLVDKVWFLGTREDVDKLLQAMDVFVMPSLFEGLPLVGVEAQAAGLPCVVSTEVTRELDMGCTFYMDLSESTEKWAEKVLEQCASTDRMQGAELVSKAGYDIEIAARKLENFYTNLA